VFCGHHSRSDVGEVRVASYAARLGGALTAHRLLASLVVAFAVVTAAAGAVTPVHVATLVASGFAHPSDVTSAPGEKQRLYVVEQRGLIRIVVGRRVLAHPFLDLRRLVRTSLLEGLFSVLFHPRYRHDARFYVDYVGKDGHLKLVEYRARSGHALPASARTLLDLDLGSEHYGGALAFGPDGMLYVGIGDGDVPADAQNVDSPRGKIVRLDVDAPAPAPQVVAIGVRNPWRFAFDRRGGLFIGDVGADTWEELDYLPAPHSGIANLGWNFYEGRQRTSVPLPVPVPRMTPPILTYRHPAKRCAAVVAGPVRHGRYYYADLCDYRIWSFRLRGSHPFDRRRERFIVPYGVVSFGLGPDGAMYAVSLPGRLYRLTG
jgi:glucose/arabinose dehydrogenase